MIQDKFMDRHIGPSQKEIDQMLETIGVKSVEELISQVVPQTIRLEKDLELPAGMSEYEFLAHVKALAAKKSSKVLENASSNGAEYLITACPLCLYNLNKNGKLSSGKELPVYYLTTLLAAALGNEDAVKALENSGKADCGCCCNGGK